MCFGEYFLILSLIRSIWKIIMAKIEHKAAKSSIYWMRSKYSEASQGNFVLRILSLSTVSRDMTFSKMTFAENKIFASFTLKVNSFPHSEIESLIDKQAFDLIGKFVFSAFHPWSILNFSFAAQQYTLRTAWSMKTLFFSSPHTCVVFGWCVAIQSTRYCALDSNNWELRLSKMFGIFFSYLVTSFPHSSQALHSHWSSLKIKNKILVGRYSCKPFSQIRLFFNKYSESFCLAVPADTLTRNYLISFPIRRTSTK